MTDPTGNDEKGTLLRPEVLACQERAENLRVHADEVFDAAAFWASLVPCPSGDHDRHGCEDPNCYDAWKDYPNG